MTSEIYKNTVLKCEKCGGQGILYNTKVYDKHSKLNDVIMCDCTKEMFRQLRLEKAGVPKNFWIFPKFSDSILKYLYTLIDDWDNIILCGPIQTGKSTYAAKILELWLDKMNVTGMDKEVGAKWLSLYELASLSKSFNYEELNKASTIWNLDILVLDEVVPQALIRKFTLEDLYFRIKNRVESTKKTAITTLISPSKFEEYLGPMLSGLLVEAFKIVDSRLIV